MATRSIIGKRNENGTITVIYCHYDGYPDHHGPILLGYYNTPEKIVRLLELGNLSCLDIEIGEKNKFEGYDFTNNNWCLAYGRDKGEDNTEANHFDSISDMILNYQYIDYFYIFEDNMWKFIDNNNTDEIVSLIDVLAKYSIG